MMLEYEGIDINSQESVKLTTELMKFKSEGEVYNYRVKLKKVKIKEENIFISQTENGLKLHSAICIKTIPEKLKFEFYIDNTRWIGSLDVKK